MIDTKVPSPMIPFPQLRRHPGSNSGSELYLAGLKIVLCTAIMKRITSWKAKFWA